MLLQISLQRLQISSKIEKHMNNVYFYVIFYFGKKTQYFENTSFSDSFEVNHRLNIK